MYYELTNIELFYAIIGIFFITFICYKIKESKHWTNRKIYQKGKPDIRLENYVILNRNHIHTHRYGVFMIGWLGACVSILVFGFTLESLFTCITLSALYMILDLLLNIKMHSFDKNWGVWHLGDELWDRLANWYVRFTLLIVGVAGFYLIPLIKKLIPAFEQSLTLI